MASTRHSISKITRKGTYFFSHAQAQLPNLCCITYKIYFFNRILRNRLHESEFFRTFAARYIVQKQNFII